jgi:hypothetical protein
MHTCGVFDHGFCRVRVRGRVRGRVPPMTLNAFAVHAETTMETLFKKIPDLPHHVDLNLSSQPPPLHVLV